MIVCPDQRLLFVQVPQTGSTAIERHLREHHGGRTILRKHSTVEQAMDVMGAELRGFTILATVRDPFDQLVSSFHKLLREPLEGPRARGDDVVRRAAIAQAGQTFAGFVAREVRHVHAPVHVRSLRRADFVMRFERLESDFRSFCAGVGMDPGPALVPANETSRPPLETEASRLTEPVRNRLARLHRPFAFEFGYLRPEMENAGWITRTRLRTAYEATLIVKGRRSRSLHGLLEEKVERARSSGDVFSQRG